MHHASTTESCNALFVDFVSVLHEYGVPASPRDVLELNRGIERDLVRDLDDLFVLARLCFVRRVEFMDSFERAFAYYFLGIDMPPVAEGDYALFETKQFREWLRQAIERGELPPRAYYTMSPEELMRLFWERVREQMKAHHGGSKWIGSKGNSPFGHSGNAEGGVRVDGASQNRSAIATIGDRRYVAYSSTNRLRGENIRQALDAMRHMQKVGAHSKLNLDESIRATVKNCGEIELVFERELLDRMKVILLIDNGGESMLPYVYLTQLLFRRLHDRFEDIKTYFFHNTIYGVVWKNEQRTGPIETEQVLLADPTTRVVLIGDACMAPDELTYPHSYRYYGSTDARASVYWLRRIAERFPFSTWLNPIPKDAWPTVYGSLTLNLVRDIFDMQEMTLGGIINMVHNLSET